jgi:RNA polymerase II-associated factor 1
MRYAKPEFLNALANETPLPMIVDAECGMPLDLGKWECLWEEVADDSSPFLVQFFMFWLGKLNILKIGLNPDLEKLPKFDPRDEFLLADPSSSTGAYPVNGSHSGSINGHPTPLAHVPWLRKTEYISREGIQKTGVQEP